MDLETNISNYLHTLPSKSYVNVADDLQKQFPNESPQKLKRIYTRLNRNEGESIRKFRGTNTSKKYYVKIYSSSPNCWFHDILENPSGKSPQYWHIFVGVNTRYVVAYPTYHRTDDAILKNMQQFVPKYKPHKLSSDDESGFNSKLVKSYLDSENVQYRFYNVKHFGHGPLRIIDRLCRTIRDMNHKMLLSTQETIDDEDYETEPINIQRMNALL